MSGFVPHAIERFFERTDLEITRNQIIRAIEGGNIVYAKRLTASKSLAYVLVGENVVKLIIAKGTKKVMSILPWKSIFKKMISIDSEHYNGLFEICLFPDCYLETKCSHSLTKINKLHPDKAKEPIPFNHPFFDGLFKIAWENFVSTEEHQKIQKERQSGNEKIETQMHTAP